MQKENKMKDGEVVASFDAGSQKFELKLIDHGDYICIHCTAAGENIPVAGQSIKVAKVLPSKQKEA